MAAMSYSCPSYHYLPTTCSLHWSAIYWFLYTIINHQQSANFPTPIAPSPNQIGKSSANCPCHGCLQSPLPAAFKRTTFSFLDRSGRKGPTQRCDMSVLSARSSLLPQLKRMSLLSKHDLSRLFHSKLSFPRTPQQFNTPTRDAGAICGFTFSETGAVAPHFQRHAFLTTAFRRTRTVI
jgi:hypothetical protein